MRFSELFPPESNRVVRMTAIPDSRTNSSPVVPRKTAFSNHGVMMTLILC